MARDPFKGIVRIAKQVSKIEKARQRENAKNQASYEREQNRQQKEKEANIKKIQKEELAWQKEQEKLFISSGQISYATRCSQREQLRKKILTIIFK